MRLLKSLSMALAIACMISCGEDQEMAKQDAQEATTVADQIRPAVMSFSIINILPHDAAAFTQGLEFRDGFLYESTGQYGASELRKTVVETGKVVQSIALDRKYFGEGMTILGDKIYMLTYREHTGFVFDLKSMKQLRTFDISTDEAWGLTNNGEHLIYGDGSSNLYFLDTANFQEVRRIRVRDQFGAVSNINELEFVDGFIFANQWMTDYVLKIDPNSGNVVGIADLRSLRTRLGLPEASAARFKEPEVLNGIAYDAAGDRFFITGKYWPYMIEAKLQSN